MSPRRRAFVAVLVASLLGYAYFVIVVHLLTSVARATQSDVVVLCDGGAFYSVDRFNGCGGTGSLHWGYVLVELLVVTLILAAAAYGLARWVTAPLRRIADTIDQFGPTSLGLRLGAVGPRDETRRLAEAIDSVLDRLAEGYEAQRRFASNASHELRTPLATQRALIEVSLSSALTADQLDLLSRQLLSTNERNERLIDGLLTLAETDGGLVTTAPVRLDEVVAETVGLLRSAADHAGVDVRTELDAGTVVGERPLLERLAHNLVSNAIKYNHPGGHVGVTVAGDGSLTVTNTGPHVAPEQLPGLFEPFRRGSGDRLDHGGGAGLGLTIARSIVVAHRATIDAHPNPDGGLTITVRFG